MFLFIDYDFTQTKHLPKPTNIKAKADDNSKSSEGSHFWYSDESLKLKPGEKIIFQKLPLKSHVEDVFNPEYI